MKINNYWDKDINDKVDELLCEYQYLFPMKFLDLKGIIRDLGFMNIMLKPNAKRVKHNPYRLNPKYKERFAKNSIRCWILVLLNY